MNANTLKLFVPLPSLRPALALILVIWAIASVPLFGSPPIERFEDEEELRGPALALNTGGHSAMVTHVLFTATGKQVISVSDDKTIRFWDVASGELLRTLRPPIGTGNAGKLNAAALSPNGETLAVAGRGVKRNEIFLVSLSTATLTTLVGHPDVVHALAFSPDGTKLVSASADGTAALWDAKQRKKIRDYRGHKGPIYGVCFSPDGQQIATASFDETARIWSTASGQAVAVLKGHAKRVFSVAWSPDGKKVATGSYDQSIRLWNPEGTLLKTFKDLENYITSITFTSDSRKLLFTRGGGGWKLVCSLLDLSSGQERVRCTSHTNTVMTGALSPDDGLAATGGYGEKAGELLLWSCATGKVLHRLEGRGGIPRKAAWSGNGEAIAWGNHDERGLQFAFRIPLMERASAKQVNDDAPLVGAITSAGSLVLEKEGSQSVAVSSSGQKLRSLRLTKNDDRVRCFTFLSENLVAVGANFGRIYLFDTKRGRLLKTFKGHSSDVIALAASPDGKYLLSAADQTLRVWTPQRIDPLLSFFFAGEEWIAWTPEGYYAASPGGEKLMGWHVNNGLNQLASFYPAAQFRKTLYRPDVIKLVLGAGSVDKALTLADQALSKTNGRTEVSKVLPPKVAITSPAKNGLRLTKAELEVQATATSVGNHPVTSLRLLLDGRPYQGQAGIKKMEEPTVGEARASWTVQLSPGKHRLVVQADSAVSQGLSEEVEVNYVGESDPEIELPGLYILAIGVSDYPGDLKLNYAAKDAQAIERVFQDKSRQMFRKVETKLLTNQQGSRGEILKGLTWLRKQMTQRDVAIFFFAGHGQKDADGSFYLLPADVDTDNLLATGVADGELKKALAGTPGRVIALLDACHAGAVGGDKRRAANPLTDDLVRDLVTDDYGVVVMASSMGREFSLESNEERQGYFTLALVEALSGKAANKDGVVYLTALDAYVTERVKELTKGRQHPVTAKPTSIRSFPLTKP